MDVCYSLTQTRMNDDDTHTGYFFSRKHVAFPWNVQDITTTAGNTTGQLVYNNLYSQLKTHKKLQRKASRQYFSTSQILYDGLS